MPSLHKWNEYQATIYTWGTVPRRNGVIQAALHKLSGRNVGHTAIKLRFPADKRGKELINKYLKSKEFNGLSIVDQEPEIKDMKEGEIYVLKQELENQENNEFNYYFLSNNQKKHHIHKLNKEFMLSQNKSLKLQLQQDIYKKHGFTLPGEKITYIKTHSYYEVYFSIWPSESSSIYNSNFVRDLYYENQGIPFNYNRNGAAYLTEELQHSYIRNWTMKSDFSFLHFFNRFNKKIALPPLFTYKTNFIEKLSKFGEEHGEIERLNLKKIVDDLNEIAIEIKELHEENYKLKSESIQLINNLNLKERKELLDLLDIININEDLLRKYKMKIMFKINKQELKMINKKINNEKYSQKIQQLFKNLETILNYKHEAKCREYKFLNLYKTNLNKYPLDQFISIGKSPDNECYLPVVDKENSKYVNSNLQGLDLEKMLKKISDITNDSQVFDFYAKNCSSGVLSIIYAGINMEMRNLLDKKLPKIKNYLNGKSRLFKILNSSKVKRFFPKVLLRFYNKTRTFTPQGVYNITSELEDKLALNQGIKNPSIAIKKLVKPVKFKKFVKLLNKIKTFFKNFNQNRHNNPSEKLNSLDKAFKSFTSIVPPDTENTHDNKTKINQDSEGIKADSSFKL